MSFINCKIMGKEVDLQAYHNRKIERGDVNFEMSPSALKEFVRCPSRWRRGYVSPESKAKQYGSLFDCRLLTPKQFDKRYAIQPLTYLATPKSKSDKPEQKDWSNNATVCKEWNSERAKEGREVCKLSDVAASDKAIARLMLDPIIASWHSACETQVWVEGMWKDDATGFFIPVRCLIDYAPKNGNEFDQCLGDLKTANSGSLKFFQRQVFTMGYHVQAAFDLALWNAATGDKRSHWCFIGQESFEPWEPFRRMLDPEFISMGRQEVDRGLRYYAKCLKSDNWPSYDDHPDAVQGWSVCSPEPWMSFNEEGEQISTLVDADLTTEQKLERAGL